MSSVLVIVPTITGREHWRDRCLASYWNNSQHEVSIWFVQDEPTCGAGWNKGWEQQRWPQHDYVHLSCDDLEPQFGWDKAAIEACEQQMIPCPLQTHADGTPWQWGRSTTPVPDWKPCNATTLPFLPWWMAEQILPGLDCHYYTDDWISWRSQQFGWGDVYREGYRFIHHLAPEGRGAGMGSADARMRHDLKIYEEAKAAWPASG